jgi:hypothetical protein
LDKAIKIPRAAFIFSKLILFAGFSFLLWKQLLKADSTFRSDAFQHPFSLLLCIFLMPLNWWFEWRKWILTNKFADSITNENVWQGFLAGMVTSMLTPGLVGNFIGRSFYAEKQQRTEIVFLTLLGNLAQFIMSVLFGVMALWILNCTPFELPFNGVFFPTVFILMSGLALFIFAGKPLQFLVRFFPSLQFVQMNLAKVKGWFLSLSLFRHMIFTIQFALMLHAFGANMSSELITWIWQVYLFVTLVPSLFFGKVIIRDSVAVFVLSQAGIGIGGMEIFAASFLVWVLNLFIPLLIALVLLRRRSYVDAAGL